MNTLNIIQTKHRALEGHLNEAMLRIWSATEAQVLGRGGVSIVSQATGMSRTTIDAGLKELQSAIATTVPENRSHRVRSKGGGRKKTDQQGYCPSQ